MTNDQDKAAIEWAESINETMSGFGSAALYSEDAEPFRRILALAKLGASLDDEGAITLDNASAQRLMDYGLLHRTDKGWEVGTWDAIAAMKERP